MTVPTERIRILLWMNRADAYFKLARSTLQKAGFAIVSCSPPKAVSEIECIEQGSIQLAIVEATPGLNVLPLLEQISPLTSLLIIADVSLLETIPGWVFAKQVRAILTKPFRRTKFLASVLSIVREPLHATA